MIATEPRSDETASQSDRSNEDNSKPHAKRKLVPVAGNPFFEIDNDLELHRKVVLKMALQRQIHDEPESKEVAPPIIKDGFFWRDYPTLEQILYDNSKSKCGQMTNRLEKTAATNTVSSNSLLPN
jgi:hypothetical protein